MKAPVPYRSVVEAAQPIACRSARIHAGLVPTASENLKAILIRAGQCVLFGDFEPLSVKEGDVVVVPPHTRCGCVSVTTVDATIAFLNPDFVRGQLRWIQSTGKASQRGEYKVPLADHTQAWAVRPDSRTFGVLQSTLTDLVSADDVPEAQGERVVRATELVRVVDSLFAGVQTRSLTVDVPVPSEPVPQLMRVVLAEIHEKYAEGIRIESLARSVWMSESGLRRAFRRSTGLTPRAYLHRVRLARYEKLVAETSIPLAEASRLVGWASASHARDAFTRLFGVSPRVYRTRIQNSR